MRITITFPDGEVHRARRPHPDAVQVVCRRRCSCGSNGYCGKVRSVESHDTYRSDAMCHRCGAEAGVMRVKVSTLFGVEEDERVLNGPWKVF